MMVKASVVKCKNLGLSIEKAAIPHNVKLGELIWPFKSFISRDAILWAFRVISGWLVI